MTISPSGDTLFAIPARSVLALIGNTPLVELTRFDTGPCRLFAKLEKSEPGGFDQGPDRPLAPRS